MKRSICLHKYSISCLVFFLLFFIGCNSLPAQTSEAELVNTSKEVLKLIKSADFGHLSEYVHESKGLQFSPYDDVYENGPDTTKFLKQKVKNFMTIEKHYNWGVYDGSGLDIKLTPKEYYKNFIYDIDFEKMADIVFIGDSKSKTPKGMNIDLGYIFKIYPNSAVAHYYYKGSPANGFCDLKKLTLVFEKIEGKWFLTGIIHGEKGV